MSGSPAAGVDRPSLVLASASPRRRELLAALGVPFAVAVMAVDETLLPGEPPEVAAERLARLKAGAACGRGGDALVLGADTVVAVGAETLGKPADEADARRMLRLLGGKWHEVLTGVALVRAETKEVLVAHERTRVRFAAMTDTEIDRYVATGEPADKAGAYAVQGRAALFIEEIEGDYWNVVGLPVRLVYKLMQESR